MYEPGPRLPVVFVHGLRTSRTMWRAQVAAVEALGHAAVAIDLPGHGRRRGERFTWGGAIDAVARGVDDVGGRALVVGLSLGGYVGIAHAARDPGQVAGLVAAGCSTRPLRPLVGAWELAVTPAWPHDPPLPGIRALLESTDESVPPTAPATRSISR